VLGYLAADANTDKVTDAGEVRFEQCEVSGNRDLDQEEPAHDAADDEKNPLHSAYLTYL